MAQAYRRLYRLENVITKNHLDNMGKMMLLTGNIVFFAYACEWYCAWYTGDPFEIYAAQQRASLDVAVPVPV